MLNEVIPVLDKGFVSLINIMPHPSMGIDCDSYVVQMARTSFLGQSKGYDADMKLLRYLIVNKHMSPFEGCRFQFMVRCDIATARQIFRYRTGSYNEISRRYTEVGDDEFHIPSVFRTQSKNNKQGSDGVLSESDSKFAMQFYKHAVYEAKRAYDQLIELGVAREQARLILPMAQMTTFNWGIDARNLIWGFLEQRCHPHAQAEIRAYALAIRDIVEYYMPKTIQIIGELNAK